MKCFGLYHNKQECKIIIKPFVIRRELKNGEVVYHNDNYFVCDSRKPLRDKAREIIEHWINDADKYMKKLKKMKIENKY